MIIYISLAIIWNLIFQIVLIFKFLTLRLIWNKLIDLNTDNLTASTEYIALADGTRVTDTSYIKEFYANTGAGSIKKITTKLGGMAVSAGLKPYKNTCAECSTDFNTEVTFDYANFFGSGS